MGGAVQRGVALSLWLRNKAADRTPSFVSNVGRKRSGWETHARADTLTQFPPPTVTHTHTHTTDAVVDEVSFFLGPAT